MVTLKIWPWCYRWQCCGIVDEVEDEVAEVDISGPVELLMTLKNDEEDIMSMRKII